MKSQILILLGLLSTSVSAQTILTVEPLSGPAPLLVTLSWDSQGSSCEASGGWSGNKAISGQEQVTITNSTVFKITCKYAENTTTLTWKLPTERTDNTPLDNLESTLVFHGKGSLIESNHIEVPVPVTSYVFNNLEEGSWVFGLKAKDGYGLISEMSTLATKTIQIKEETAEVLATILTPPKPPTLVTVETTAYEIRNHHIQGLQVWRPVGDIKLGIECNSNFRIGEYYEVPLSSVENLKRLPGYPVVVARCQIS